MPDMQMVAIEAVQWKTYLYAIGLGGIGGMILAQIVKLTTKGAGVSMPPLLAIGLGALCGYFVTISLWKFFVALGDIPIAVEGFYHLGGVLGAAASLVAYMGLVFALKKYAPSAAKFLSGQK